MKNNTLIKLALLSAIFYLSACQDKNIITPVTPPVTGTITTTLTFDGLTRSFILYVPQSYTGTQDVPLVLNYHGYTSNAEAQMYYGDFRSLAESEGFIIVHPQGTLLDGATHWNVDGWTLGSTVDDVGFTAALIDYISERYSINSKKVYATGMSNGGYMSFLLACQLSTKIAAIASVTGSMTPENYQDCNPQHPMPVLQIHGTEDGVVSYNGETWSEPVTTVVDYWANYNNCDADPIVVNLPDIDTTDGSVVKTITFNNGNNGVVTRHYKVIGGGHNWPGTVGNMDISASNEIWEFFSMYDIDGLIE